MKSIYLTGFMGAGKTTVGKALGEYLEIPIFDLDAEIEKKECCTIQSIFERYGESYFREIESAVLQEMPTENTIITTGGGIICRNENRQFLKVKGFVIFLYASEEEIYRRLIEDKTRPLLSGDKRANIANLYNERLPIYRESADMIIDTTGKSIRMIVQEIHTCLDSSENGQNDCDKNI
ncbi:shikimate kinase [Cytobacillus eiseniae]|uniref:Shikimate kinase n=1 Tax=Cytobacillus eiseniae TaxID=762947 RepID=A0ABS4RD85_9BACI|nr:shikimate kinase [Cytobacillus eiseniae]MBP2240861.1 shikimate kinase [Cytobacillus eiseniae]